MRKKTTVKGLPFEIDRKKLQEILTNEKGFFERIGDDIETDESDIVLSKKDPIDKKLLPFYSANVTNLESSYIGQYGHDRYETYTTLISTGKIVVPITQTRVVTDWYNCSGDIYPVTRPFGIKKTQI